MNIKNLTDDELLARIRLQLNTNKYLVDADDMKLLIERFNEMRSREYELAQIVDSFTSTEPST